MPTDFYDVLGAPADASSEELKRAYRGRVREYHPDVNDHPEGDAQFKLIRKANDVLSDPAERKDYDRMGHREYVDKRLDDLPPLSVLPELEAEESSSSGSETADSGGSSSDTNERRTGESRSSGSASASTSTASSSRSSGRSQSSGTARSTGQSQSAQSSRSSSSTQSTDSGRSAGSDRSTASSGTTESSRTTTSSGTDRPGRSTESTSAGAERSNPAWDDVTEQTARAGTAQSSMSPAARRRRGLRRWYGVVLLSLLAYLAGVGAYAAPHTGTLSGLATGLTTAPVATLTGAFPLPSPTAYVLGTAGAAASGEPSVGLLFLVGAIALPAVVLTAVAQFGHGSAWIYALASLGPVLPLTVAFVAPLPTALALVGLVVLPLFSGLGFLVDVGRYLYATR